MVSGVDQLQSSIRGQSATDERGVGAGRRAAREHVVHPREYVDERSPGADQRTKSRLQMAHQDRGGHSLARDVGKQKV